MMDIPLAALIVEDSESDAELIVRLLQKAGYDVSYERVETADEMQVALEQQVWNIVIADYRLPQFDAPAALKLLQATGLDIPFIVVSGTIGEETAVAMMRAGAHDYLMKNNLARLAPAVERELHEAETRRERKQAEEALRQQSQDLALINRLNQALNQGVSLGDLVSILSEEFTRLFSSSASNIYLLNGEKQHLVMQGLYTPGRVIRRIESLIGISTPSINIPLEGVSLYYRAIQEKKSLLCNDPQAIRGMITEYAIHTPLPETLRPTLKKFIPKIFELLGYQGIIIVPLLAVDEPMGLLEVPKKAPFSGEDLRRIEIIAGQLTSAILRKRAEEMLRESEEKMQSIVRAAPTGIGVVVNRVFTEVNQRLCDVTGYTRDELLGQSARMVYPSDADYEYVGREKYGQIAKTGTGTVETHFRRKDGTVIDVLLSSAPIDTADLSRGVTFTALDITERRRAEKVQTAIHKISQAMVSTESLKELYHSIHAILGELMPVENYYIALYDPANDLLSFPYFVDQYDQPPPPRKSGRGLTEYVLRNGHSLLAPQEVFDQLVQQGEVESMGADSVDWLGVPLRVEGQVIGVMVTQSYTEGIHFNRENADLLEFVSAQVAQAIERKRAEEALRESVAHYRALVEGTPGIVYSFSNQRGGLYYSPRVQDVLGYSPEYLYGRPMLWHDSIHPDDLPLVDRSLLQIASGQVFHIEYRIRDARGHWLWLDDRSIEGRGTGDEIIVEGLALDITERKQAEEALRAKVAALQTLADIGQTITSMLDLDRLLLALLERVRQATGAEACSVALIEPRLSSTPRAGGSAGGHELVFRQAAGEVSQTVVGVRLQPGQGIAGWVASHGQPVLVPDVVSDPRFYAQVDRRTGFTTRDLVCVPLMVRDVVTGVIELVNKREGRFGQDDVQLLTSVAAQAAIAIENARLFENERAGRQRLETLYRIGQTINSTLDAGAILDRLTEEAMRATRATHGSALVARPESGYFEWRSLRGYSLEQAERARSLPLSLRQGANGRAYWTQQVVYLSDAWADPDYFPLIPDTRSELAVPILHGDQVLGNLDLQSPDVDAFRDVDLDFVLALTNQVAIALENARLFQETRRRLDELSVVSNVALVGAAGRPFDETVARATQAMSSLWPEASLLGFLFVDEAERVLRSHPTYRGLPSGRFGTTVPLDQGLTGWAVRERQPVLVGDVLADPRYLSLETNTQSEMAAPLVAGERVIGVVNVDSPRPDAFSGDDLRLLTTLAGQLATIFEKARLDAELEIERDSLARRVEERTAELRIANEQLRQAHEQVSRALEKEKELGELKSRFISMTSHEFRTPLTGILSSAEMLEEYGDRWSQERKLVYLRRIQTSVQHMTDLLNDILVIGRAEAGKLAFHPAPLDLLKFCQELMEELQLTTGNQHTLTFASVGECVQAHMDENLLRHILTNLLSNAIKYSPQGGEVLLTLICQADQAIFRVQDQGIGIPPEDQARLFDTFHRAGNVRNIPGTGLGLAIVKRSVDAQGGTIRVESQVGVGTTVTVTLPGGTAKTE